MEMEYKIVHKKEAIKMLKDLIKSIEASDDENIVFITNIDSEKGVYRHRRGNVHEGIKMVNGAMSIVFSNTPVMGSLDLYDKRLSHINQEQLRNKAKVDNILFPLLE